MHCGPHSAAAVVVYTRHILCQENAVCISSATALYLANMALLADMAYLVLMERAAAALVRYASIVTCVTSNTAAAVTSIEQTWNGSSCNEVQQI